LRHFRAGGEAQVVARREAGKGKYSPPGVGHRQASTVLLPVESRVELVLGCAQGARMGIVLGDGLLAE
jgi:hypothetical protein